MTLDRRRFLQRSGWSLAGLALGKLAAAAPTPGRPNIILILSDDQGWNGMSVPMHPNRPDACSDYYETPNLARLARQGMRFSQGYAPAPICTPTRRSIQFGMTPARQRGTEFTSSFNPTAHRSIPQVLKAIDPTYATAHYGKWGSRMGADPASVGYDDSDGGTNNVTGGYDPATKDPWFNAMVNDDPKRTFSVTRRAMNFMAEQAAAQRPFYLQVSYYAVHVDIEARQATLEKYRAKAAGRVHRSAPFGAMTEDMDTGVGMILDQVRALGLENTTYIFFMADNGGVPRMPPNFAKRVAPPDPADPFQNDPLRGGKWTLFEGGIRVPFMVAGPGVAAGSFCTEPVVGWDLLPTFAELAGTTENLPEELDGYSFAKLLQDGGRGAIARTPASLVWHAPFKSPGHSAVRLGDYKLVKFYDPPRLLLFDLKTDLGETRDLAAAMPDKVAELHRALLDYLAAVDARMPNPS